MNHHGNFQDTLYSRTSGLWGLPDPDRHPGFYDNVPQKRLLAFIVDSIVVGVLTLLIVPFTAFTAIFFLPLLAMVVNFIYRTLTIASHSATWGMRLAGIELRTHRGEHLDFVTAAAHTFLFSLFLGMLLPMVISAGLMLGTSRRQGLHDMVLGTAALNRAA